MHRSAALIFRWLAWALLVSFESVVGFPWLSLYLAGEWLLKSSGEMTVFGLFLMAVIFSAAYSIPLTLSTMVMLGLWQVLLRTRRNARARWAAYAIGAVAIGRAAGIGLNFLTAGMTCISLLIFAQVSGGNFLRKSWQKTKRLPLSEA